MRRTGLMLVVVLWAAAAFAGLEFEVVNDHTNLIYRVGEEASFTVTARDGKAGLAAKGTVDVVLDNFGPGVQLSNRVDLAKGNPFTVKGKLAEPGFLRLTLNAKDTKTKVWGVAYEPEKIRPATARPADFDAFWDEATRKLAAEVPVDMKQERLTQYCTDRREVYLVSFATVGDEVAHKRGWETPIEGCVRVYI